MSFQHPDPTKISTHGTFSVSFWLNFWFCLAFLRLFENGFVFSTFYPFWKGVVFNRRVGKESQKKRWGIREFLISTVSTAPNTATTKSFFHSFILSFYCEREGDRIFDYGSCKSF